MITFDINFKKLKHGIITTKKGTRCLLLPIDDNDFFENENKLSINFVAWEHEGKYGDTHLIKQSFSKEKREKMGEAAIKALPILGNMKAGNTQEAVMPDNTPGDDDLGGEDDLPF